MSRGTPPCKNVYTQEILVAGQPFCRHRWGDSVKRRNEHIRNRTKYNIKIRIDRNPTKQKKVNFGSAQRFFKCCGLTDKNSRASWRDFEILRGISNFLFIRFTISCFTPKDVLRKRGWEALIHAVA